ncbi:uncharacterized protein IWZ02DRAFT_521955 [Phyllosticta citriasiana]|uniref:uncharacterized protein n=1 Tax=Phyllosticta citriasiana TaxID=595635 RepID=UPI0030FD7037
MAGPIPQSPFTTEVSTEVSFQRAAKLLQEAFLVFREGLYDQDTTFNFLDEGNVILSHDFPREPRDAPMATDHVPIYELPYATPYELNNYPDQTKRTLLMIFQCMDSCIVMAPMINSILGPYCSRIEEVHFQPKNEALWARWIGEENEPRVTHYILRATLHGSGAQYAIDMTSPQYNWHEDPPAHPWDWYVANRMASETYIIDAAQQSLWATHTDYIEDWLCDFTDTGAPVFFADPHRSALEPGLFAHGRWMLRRDFADGIAAFEAKSLPLAHLVALPQAQFAHYAGAFLSHLRLWVTSVPRRWRAIKNLYGVRGPVAQRIRRRRIVEQRQPFGAWVDDATGERVSENMAYCMFMGFHGRRADEERWHAEMQQHLRHHFDQQCQQQHAPPALHPVTGFFQLPPPPADTVVPGQTLLHDPTLLPPFRPASVPNGFVATGAAAGADLNIAGVTAQRPLVVPRVQQRADVDRLLVDAGAAPLGQMADAQIDNMLQTFRMQQTARQQREQQQMWDEFMDLDA